MRRPIVLIGLAVVACKSEVTTTSPGPEFVAAPQPYQPPQNCAPCHQRQFDETQQSVMSGYRSVSPLMNSLELAGNFAAQGALENGAIGNNLRPVYPQEGEEGGTNVLNSVPPTGGDQIRSAFCIGCHASAAVVLGDDPDRREIPEWEGVLEPEDPSCTQTSTVACFRRITNVRPLRDYHLVDANGEQVLPAVPGGPPPEGSGPSLGAHAITCDVCHNVQGPAFERSLAKDGFANNALEYDATYLKVGPFADARPAGPFGEEGVAFHESSSDPAKIDFLRSSEFCIACHDVRVPSGNVIAPEDETLPYFRLENLGTEWSQQAYANPEANPFGQVVRCQDCHMSLYPYTDDATYQVVDDTTGDTLTVTGPTPGVFAMGKAAVGIDDPTGRGIELPDRPIVTHQFTGVDVPLLSDEELRARLGPDRPETFREGEDEFGVPHSLETRRKDLLDASVRIDLSRTDASATFGEPFDVRVTAVALTGHNFPSGFSQERTTWIELTVSAPDANGDDFVLYQSGYLTDKAHPETGELVPDGNLDDEDLGHLLVTINPFTHDNEIFERGPDAGPLARIFEGEATGLVLFRNELIRLYGPEMFNGAPTGIPASNRRHPRTGEMLTQIVEEETFSAGLANAVDNWRALQPLVPRTYRYEVMLPTRAKLASLGVDIVGPIKVQAKVHFQHFPPLFMRFLARTSGSVPYQLPPTDARVAGFDVARFGYQGAEGRLGPADHDFTLMDEARIDRHLKIVRDIATAETMVSVTQ
ncbi:MAG: hypothetical protein RIT81_07475 [Deltaproteobacteria bacterium]